ncbi:hypothetical protein QQF64_034853 [Cirrhinus molitorella]|uniref:Uncharacterized protein n=1 Tax=Cirrhinus molitorella TaxID=172907 RepID=A0ABR3NEY5_9TELE
MKNPPETGANHRVTKLGAKERGRLVWNGSFNPRSYSGCAFGTPSTSGSAIAKTGKGCLVAGCRLEMSPSIRSRFYVGAKAFSRALR